MKEPDPAPSAFRFKALVLLPILLGFGLLQSVNAQTHALTNTWRMAPTTGTNSFMNITNHLTRGMAYNPVTGHVLVASRTPTATQTNAIYILNSATGAILGTLPYDTTVVTGGTFPINMVAVTTDGVIYVCNLSTDAGTTAFRLYRWANETATPTLAYSGDPSFGNAVGASPRRFGDSMVIRGTGTGTQILLGTLNQTMALLTTTDGENFNSTPIQTDGDASDTRWGLAWGAGDTFWAKQPTKNLKRYNLNLAAGTATVAASTPIYTVPGGSVLVPGGPLDVDLERNLLAIIDTTNHKLRVYDISNPASPVQTDGTKDMPGANANGNNVGAVYLKNGLLFALETNNGIDAYTVHGGVTFPPAVSLPPANAPSLWEGARWVFAGGGSGTPPLSYQWQFEGTNLTGQTQSSLVIPAVSTNDVGSYRLIVSNPSGSATSTVATIGAPVAGNRTAQVTNLWDVLPLTRPYVNVNHTDYGLAINPVNTNVIVLTRQIPTNMLVVLDPWTGAEKYYIDYSPLLPISSGWNKVDVADDGTVYLCNLSYNTGSNPFRIDALSNDGPNPGLSEAGRELYKGDPGNGATPPDVVWGIAMAVRGNWNTAQILLGSGSYDKSSKTVAILQADSVTGQFTSTAITIPDAPDKFSRLGIDWGPGTNTFWAKGVGVLTLVEFDLGAGTGFVKKTIPVSGSRSVPASVTGIRYDRNYNLLAGILNGAPPSPVSVPVYNVADLDAGPLWVDQELYATYNSEVNFQGNVDFANGFLVAMGGNNGIKGFRINPGFVPAPIIVSHPVGGVYFEGASSPTLTVVADSATPLSYQWYKEEELLAGKTAASLTLPNIQQSQAGDYWVRVSTAGGYIDSRRATIELVPLQQTAQMTNIWTVQALTRPYLNDFYYEYGMSFNPVNSNLLVASYIPTNNAMIIGVMDALTGAHKHTLNLDAITNGGNRWINKIGVADDGVVYAANRTTTPTTVPLVVYRWANDNPNTVATEAFKGDPFATLYAGTSKNCGFTMDVRGAGANTEILLSTAGTNVLSILKTTDGVNFTRNEFRVPGVPNAFARLGITFGAGNTVWAKAWEGDGGLLRLVEYDLASGTGTVLRTYTTDQVSSTMTTVAYNDDLKFLAGIARDTHKNIQLYNVADLDAGPMLLDQEVFPTYNASIEANGALDFGGNTYLFALNENNGIMAMLINSSYGPPTLLKASVSNNTLTITWRANVGARYQVKQMGAIDGSWQNVGDPITASSTTGTYTETVQPGPRFFRVESLNP